MTKQITLEEALKLVTFEQDSDGFWFVQDVNSNVSGHVYGDVGGHVYGDVGGDVYCDVCGNVDGNVKGNIYGNGTISNNK